MNFNEEQINRLSNCVECPRSCGVNRFDAMGYCRSHAIPKIASVNLHYGEEPPISGERGSGTIFFSGCNLSCIFCQNYPISQLGNGKETNLDSLVDAMLRLQKRGAHNINFVTPSHATVTLEVAIPEARKLGLEIPIVYNTSGYDSLQQLRRLDGLIDIYLSDIRYADHEVAEELSNARDYPEVNRVALIEMQQQVGNLDLDKHGIARRGLVIRHLVFPCGLANTSSALDFIANEISPEAHVALMSQYFPAYKAVDSPSLNRKINKEEWVEAVRLFRSSGLNGWVQKKE